MTKIITKIMWINWLVALSILLFAKYTNGEEQESSLQSCIDAFVVHRDKIIRTKDSEDMGAKYLTEFDVETRFDCMRLCCETTHCDVFIFEEKVKTKRNSLKKCGIIISNNNKFDLDFKKNLEILLLRFLC